MVDLLANAINKIKVYESMGINECMIPSTKPIKAVLEVMKKNNYIQELEEVEEGKFKQLKHLLHTFKSYDRIRPLADPQILHFLLPLPLCLSS